MCKGETAPLARGIPQSVFLSHRERSHTFAVPMNDPAITPPPIPPEPNRSTELPPRVAACLACVFPLVGGLIFLAVEKRSAFVRFYAMQSVYFGGASVVLYVVFYVVEAVVTRIPILGGLIGWAVSLVWAVAAVLWLAVYILLVVKSFVGREWEIPYVGGLARQQLSGSS